MRIAVYKDKQLQEKFCGDSNVRVRKTPWDNKYFTMIVDIDPNIQIWLNFDDNDVVVEDSDVCWFDLNDEVLMDIKATKCPN